MNLKLFIHLFIIYFILNMIFVMICDLQWMQRNFQMKIVGEKTDIDKRIHGFIYLFIIYLMICET